MANARLMTCNWDRPPAATEPMYFCANAGVNTWTNGQWGYPIGNNIVGAPFPPLGIEASGCEWILTDPGTLDHLYVVGGNNIVNPGFESITVWVNGNPTTLTATANFGDIIVFDYFNTVHVNTGDAMSFYHELASNGDWSTFDVSLRFTPD